jgi:hypothetical protein
MARSVFDADHFHDEAAGQSYTLQPHTLDVDRRGAP